MVYILEIKVPEYFTVTVLATATGHMNEMVR